MLYPCTSDCNNKYICTVSLCELLVDFARYNSCVRIVHVADSVYFVDEKMPDCAAKTGSFICQFLSIVGVQQFFRQFVTLYSCCRVLPALWTNRLLKEGTASTD
jgi:hypothetical protein